MPPHSRAIWDDDVFARLTSSKARAPLARPAPTERFGRILGGQWRVVSFSSAEDGDQRPRPFLINLDLKSGRGTDEAVETSMCQASPTSLVRVGNETRTVQRLVKILEACCKFHTLFMFLWLLFLSGINPVDSASSFFSKQGSSLQFFKQK